MSLKNDPQYKTEVVEHNFSQLDKPSVIQNFSQPVAAILSPSEYVLFERLGLEFNSVEDFKTRFPNLLINPDFFLKINSQEQVNRSSVITILENTLDMVTLTMRCYDKVIKEDDVFGTAVVDALSTYCLKAVNTLKVMQQDMPEKTSEIEKYVKRFFTLEGLFGIQVSEFTNEITVIAISFFCYLYTKLGSMISKLNPNVISKKFTAWDLSLPRKGGKKQKRGKMWFQDDKLTMNNIQKVSRSQVNDDVSFKKRKTAGYTIQGGETDNQWTYLNYTLSHFDIFSIVKIIPEIVYDPISPSNAIVREAINMYTSAKNLSNYYETNWRSLLFKVSFYHVMTKGNVTGDKLRGVNYMTLDKGNVHPVNISYDKKTNAFKVTLMDTKNVFSTIKKDAQTTVITGGEYLLVYVGIIKDSKLSVVALVQEPGASVGYGSGEAPQVTPIGENVLNTFTPSASFAKSQMEVEGKSELKE